MRSHTTLRRLGSGLAVAGGLILALGCGTENTTIDTPKPVPEPESYRMTYVRLATPGQILIETDPPGALAYFVNMNGQTAELGTTPLTFKCPATGTPYAFRVRLDGYYERRVSITPRPENPAVQMLVVLKPDMFGEKAVAPMAPDEYKNTPERRNFGEFKPFDYYGQPAPRPGSNEERALYGADEIAPESR